MLLKLVGHVSAWESDDDRMEDSEGSGEGSDSADEEEARSCGLSFGDGYE